MTSIIDRYRRPRNFTKGLPAENYNIKSQQWEFFDDQGRFHREDGPAIIRKNKSHIWYNHGNIHCEHEPAIYYSNGSQEWIVNNKRHRENDKPAVIRCNGAREWWINGKRHREGNPALIDNNREEWYINGKPHREGDLPARSDKRVPEYGEWFIKGKRHRENDLPALIATNHWDNDTTIMGWYHKGKRHRLTGPASIYESKKDPSLNREYWCIEGRSLSPSEIIQHKINLLLS